MGRPVETFGDFVAQLCESVALFPDYFGEDLLFLLLCPVHAAAPSMFGDDHIGTSPRYLAPENYIVLTLSYIQRCRHDNTLHRFAQ